MEIFLNMSSNLIALLIFAVAALIVYYVCPKSKRHIVLLLVSILFYGLCDLKMLAVLVVAAIFTWYCGLQIGKSHGKKWLVIGCVVLVGVLAFFKYNNFMIEGVNKLLQSLKIGDGSGILRIIMPLGISYYIFKAISYMVDIYRSKYSAEQNVLIYSTYILFFPEIMCGPISRFDKFKTALDEGMDYDNVKIQEGFYLILKGLFMKVVIANRLSVYVGKIFASPTSFTGIALWLAAFFYSVQLYCDFAGYSSIAVGISRLFGMHYTENFKRPYFAHNIKEFWDRWHISLSSWLKDYIYIPLGGNRCSKLRQKFNVLAVFFVSGIWHGVGFNYIIWGLYHGVLNILVPKKKKDADKCGWLKILLNFALVTVGWIFFGTSSFTTAIQYIKSMFANLTVSSSAIQSALFPLTSDNTCVSFFLIVMAFIFALFIRELYEEKKDISVSKPASIAWQVFLLVSIFLFGEFGASAFIYANF